MNATEHGSAVAINGQAVLFRGGSGTGKSDLALRLIDRGASLIADDRVIVAPDLVLSGPETLAGKLEIRGLGIVALPFCNDVALRLLVELGEEGDRAPPSWPLADFHGWSVPVLRIDGFSASAPVRIEHALQTIIASGLLPTSLSAIRGHD